MKICIITRQSKKRLAWIQPKVVTWFLKQTSVRKRQCCEDREKGIFFWYQFVLHYHLPSKHVPGGLVFFMKKNCCWSIFTWNLWSCSNMMKYSCTEWLILSNGHLCGLITIVTWLNLVPSTCTGIYCIALQFIILHKAYYKVAKLCSELKEFYL